MNQKLGKHSRTHERIRILKSGIRALLVIADVLKQLVIGGQILTAQRQNTPILNNEHIICLEHKGDISIFHNFTGDTKGTFELVL